MLVYYKNCLKYNDNSGYVALDAASGGYPFCVGISEAHDFPSQVAAEEYAAMEQTPKFSFVSVRCSFHEAEG